MSEKNKIYYENNKHKYCETVICEGCGVEYRKYTKGAHEKTKKHTTKALEKELEKLKTVNNMEKKDVLEQMEKKKKEIKNLEENAIKNAIKVLDKLKIQLQS